MEAHGTKALRFALLTLRDRAESEDVVQEAFLRLWRHSLRRGLETLSPALLFHTITNLCRDHMRHRKRHPEDSSDLMELVHAAAETGDLSEELAVMEAVMQLEMAERQCILMFYYMDHSLKETAAALGLNEQAVKTRLFRARQHLRPLLAPIWKEEML
ncbi:MAG: RNA polymerase sigma factor [Firmicutes bacterium]|jgi:RNA polymerase sigma-70 factor (ECF subfamily)|nr:RNA polymerase sigma factor [Bacillota bacterium]